MKKLLLFLFIISGINSFGQYFSRYRNVSLDTASKQVNVGFTSISNINIAYPGTNIVYVKFYDSASKVYAKANAPVLTIQLGTDAAISPKSIQSFTNLQFTNGLYIRTCTSILDTAQTGVQPAIKPLIEITF